MFGSFFVFCFCVGWHGGVMYANPVPASKNLSQGFINTINVAYECRTDSHNKNQAYNGFDIQQFLRANKLS